MTLKLLTNLFTHDSKTLLLLLLSERQVANGVVRGSAGHLPHAVAGAAEVPADDAPAAAAQRRVHPAPLGRLPLLRHVALRLPREVPSRVAGHAGE